MKALTIQQPWAHAIARGWKRIENRSWPTKYRGPLAIHAGKGLKSLSVETPELWREVYGRTFERSELVFGAIIAVVELVDCLPKDQLPDDLRDDPFAEGPWCWVLANVRVLPAPYPCVGALSLWTVPVDLSETVRSASAH